MSIATERHDTLIFLRWAAGRLAICEVHYFRAAERFARTDHERARVLRERWRGLAIEFGEMFQDATRKARRLGRWGAARRVAEECGHRIHRGRAEYLAAERLDPALRHRVPLAVEGLAAVSRARAELN